MSDSEAEADSYPEWYHPDHRLKDRAPQPISELRGPERWTLTQSAVKLVFIKGGNEAIGSGFIVRLPPDAIPGDLVILTAAHNLATPTGDRTTNLRVYFASGPPVPVDVSQTYFCPDYGPNCSPASDYGFIRVPSNDPSSVDWGFGFSLQFAYYPPEYASLFHIEGYTPSSATRQDMSCQPLISDEKDVVKYNAKTEQGISGSAVWLVYENAPVVVAIHNNGAKKDQPNDGSRGASITAKLLQNLYEWLGSPESLIVQNKKLKAAGTNKKPAPNDGLFLSFSFPRGRVSLGTGSSLDRILVQSIPGEKKYGFVYALRQSDEKKKWVQYNTKTNEVLLDNKLGRDCFTFWESTKNGSIVQVGLSAQSTADWRRLQLGGKYVTKTLETFEVYLAEQGDKNSYPFLKLA